MLESVPVMDLIFFEVYTVINNNYLPDICSFLYEAFEYFIPTEFVINSQRRNEIISVISGKKCPGSLLQQLCHPRVVTVLHRFWQTIR